MDERDKALLDVVAKMPPTWTCMRCKREFPTHPGGEQPYAQVTQWDDKGQWRRVIGEICNDCSGK